MFDPRGIPDLVYGNNNGVYFVLVNPLGCLPSLLNLMDKGWVFGDAHGDATKEKVMHGTKADWEKFKRMCTELGLRVQFRSIGVPFSNGEKLGGGYKDGEIAMRHDDDPPTIEDLKRVLAQATEQPESTN